METPVRLMCPDQHNFDELWTTWYPRMSAYAREFLPQSTEDREEAASDIVLKMWQERAQYNQSWAYSTWAYRLARNFLIDLQRQRHRSIRRMPVTTHETVFTMLDHRPAFQPETNALMQEEKLKIRQAVEQLELIDREILYLVYSENLSIDETARICEKPPGTIKSRLSRSREKLRRLLEDRS